MKTNIIIAGLLLVLGNGFAQVSSESFNWDGQTRTYNLYVPTSYSPGDTVPLVFCLHGLGGSGPSFMNTGFNSVADTANFIAVYPTALFDAFLGGNGWNCGIGTNSNDDIGFMYALIDTISKSYGIDTLRIHATGFSLGGYMTNRMGCEMSDKIASIASVSGLIGSQVNCNPSRSLSMMHMHGTTDGTITWDGMSGGFPLGQSVDTTISTWKSINNCPDVAVQTTLPDIANDGYTIDHYDYSPCDDNTEVELYKINGAGHEWMFTGNDVDSRVEIWRFFYRNRFPSSAGTTPIETNGAPLSARLIPNPANESIVMIGDYSSYMGGLVLIYDSAGRMVVSQEINKPINPNFDVSDLVNGVYFLRLEDPNNSFNGKFIISR